MPGRPEPRVWPRAAALLVATIAFSVVQPGVLVAVPFMLLALLVPPRRFPTVVLALMAGLLVFGSPVRSGAWYLERGWALLAGGWFVALTLRWPGSGFVRRGLGAVAGAFAVTALVLWVRPGDWSVLDWLVQARIERSAGSALEALRLMRGGEGVSEALVAAAYRTAEVQWTVFPALVGLTTLSALGVAWWLYVRLARGSDSGLAPLAQFRFNDQLVWVLIAGMVPVAVAAVGGAGPSMWPGAWGDAPVRFGTNALVFMGALYALRGAAVVVFLYGGLNALGVMLFILGLLFLAPVIVSAAVIIGIGDTWLDVRRRVRPDAPPS